MAKESWYLNESEADDYQIKVLRKNLQSSFIVKGCAGSGKTIIALWRAAELKEQGEDDYLIIVFTKALKQFILDGVRELGLDGSKVKYHWEWSSEGFPKANYIIVDEVQDFDRDEIAQLKNAAKKHLILFGDSAQQIYSGLKDGLLTMEEIHIKTRIPIENLVINHRLPKKIARIAELISTSKDALVERCKKEGVHKPRLIKCLDINQQFDYIRGVVLSEEYEDVGILFPSNDDVKRAYNYYLENGWDVERKEGYGRNSMNLNFSTTNPKLMTYHSAKGLQFEAVFLPNFMLSDMVNPAYVAVTRTYRDLFILYSGNSSPLDSLIPDSMIEFIDGTGYKGDFKNEPIPSSVDLAGSADDFDDDLPF